MLVAICCYGRCWLVAVGVVVEVADIVGVAVLVDVTACMNVDDGDVADVHACCR